MIKKLSVFLILGVIPLFAANTVSAVAENPPAYMKNFPKESFHKLMSSKQVIGKSSASWSFENSRIKFLEDSEMRLTLFKKAQNISTHILALTNASLEIQSLNFSMTTPEAVIEISGERSGSVLKLKVTQAGKTQIKDVTIQEPMLISPTIRPFLLMKGLPEKKYTTETVLLEPSALTTVPLTLQVDRKTPTLWTVAVKYLSQQMVSEMDKDGRLLTEKSDLAGLPIEASPVAKEQYQTIVLEGTKSDLVEVAKVPFPHIAKSKELKNFTVRLSGIDLKNFDLNRNRQTMMGDKVAVKIETPPQSSVPVQTLVGQKGLERYLEGDTSLPVYDPLIQKTAKEIVGKETDLWKRALLIHSYVYRNLAKVPTISVPNALEVLQTKRGDCNEHAFLYTALARAVGIPSRVVVGLVYSDSFYGDSGFYYHAWVEVFTGKSWIAIDPTWNQVPADATHIAFVEGGLDQQVQVTSLMGKIKLWPVSPQVN